MMTTSLMTSSRTTLKKALPKKALRLGVVPALLAAALCAAAPHSAEGLSPQGTQCKSAVYQYYAKDGHVPLRRVPVLDKDTKDSDGDTKDYAGGTKPAYVWIILGDPQEGRVYGSLSSPQLRKLLLTYPKGTIIEDVRYGSDPVVFHRVPTAEDRHAAREMKDFVDFCTAHGFRFTEMPTI